MVPVDPGVLDTHEVAWDFGDGTCVAFHSATDDGAMLVQHAYVKKGSYTVTFPPCACSSSRVSVSSRDNRGLP